MSFTNNVLNPQHYKFYMLPTCCRLKILLKAHIRPQESCVQGRKIRSNMKGVTIVAKMNTDLMEA